MLRLTATMASPRNRPGWMQPNVHLIALLCLLATGFLNQVHAQSNVIPPANTLGLSTPQATLTPNRGWEDLADMLDTLTPSIDTSEKRSGEQIALEIETLINQGQAQKALELIQQREATLAKTSTPGTDVQLMFQKARALWALNRTAQAQDIYQHMTTRYPELPEPWNNLAVIYAQQGQLELAEQALKTAQMNNPANADTQANLADVQLLMKLRDYRQAAKQGEPGAKQRLNALENLLSSK